MLPPKGMKLRRLLLFMSFLFVPNQSPAVENIRVAYPSMSSSVFYLIIAQKEGYFREESLNVEMLSIRGEIAIRTALAGEVDFFTNAGSALAGAVRGVPVKILTVTQDRPGWDLIAIPEIKSIKQLRGTTIGIMSPEGSLAVVTREILRKNGMDPAKDANLVVMGGDDVRYPALKGKAIQATLMNTTTSLRAQREGFSKLTSAAEYGAFLQGGLAAADDKIKQNPAKVARFIRAALKGLNFLVTKREATIKYMMETLRLKDRDLTAAIYDAESTLILREGFTDEKILQSFIEDMKKTTKVQKNIRVGDIFDLSFVRKANEELKASGWRP
jgi:ABC-type nitrate/sulfonate/bicarbonate transport system substrate-binding protein